MVVHYWFYDWMVSYHRWSLLRIIVMMEGWCGHLKEKISDDIWHQTSIQSQAVPEPRECFPENWGKVETKKMTKKLFYDIEIHLMSQEQWNAFANLTMKMIAIMLIQSIIIHDCIDEQTITGIATIMIVVISILAFSWSWWHCTCC